MEKTNFETNLEISDILEIKPWLEITIFFNKESKGYFPKIENTPVWRDELKI